jgi:hypothetical protein
LYEIIRYFVLEENETAADISCHEFAQQLRAKVVDPRARQAMPIQPFETKSIRMERLFSVRVLGPIGKAGNG